MRGKKRSSEDIKTDGRIESVTPRVRKVNDATTVRKQEVQRQLIKVWIFMD